MSATEAKHLDRALASTQQYFLPSVRIILAIYGCCVVAALLTIPHFALPAEDAVILFQYSRNLALHGSVTYLGYGPPVEGATDFAWMLVLAAADKLGAAPFWTCAVLNALSAIGLALVLLRLARLRLTSLKVLATIGTFGLVPQIFAALAGFAVLEDAFFLALTVLCVLEKRTTFAAASGLLLCLFRPDAVFFVVPLLVWLLWSERTRQAALELLFVFVLPALAYFFWRWSYFHELLPLPFLVKANTPRTLGLVVTASVRRSLPYLAFAGIVLFVVSRKRNLTGSWLLLPLLVLPTAFYWAMRLDQNVAARFFFYIPLATALLCAINWPEVQLRRPLIVSAGLAAWLLLLALPLRRELRTFQDLQFRNVQQIALGMRSIHPTGTLLVSEAGMLAYDSGWPTVDAWGLNTPQFAHHFLQPSDVGALNPDVIVLHADVADSCTPQPGWPSAYPQRTWTNLLRNLVLGADPAKYSLWLLPYGSPSYQHRRGWQPGQGDRECWFLRKDSLAAQNLKPLLKSTGAVQ